MKKCFLITEGNKRDGLLSDMHYIRFFESKESAVCHFENRYFRYIMDFNPKTMQKNGSKLIRLAYMPTLTGISISGAFWAELIEIKKGKYVPKRKRNYVGTVKKIS